MGGVLTDLVRWVIDVVHSLGYVGVFALILAGSVYLPVPTELPLFGFLIGNGRLSFAPCCSRRHHRYHLVILAQAERTQVDGALCAPASRPGGYASSMSQRTWRSSKC